MKTFRKIICAAAALLSLSLLNSCGSPSQNSGKLKIVCTTFPQYDFARNVLGGDEGLTLLVDDGTDLHSYSPTAGDIVLIGKADLFVYVGGVSDSWVEGALKSAENPELKTLAMTDAVELLENNFVAGKEFDPNYYEPVKAVDPAVADEHVWLSIRNASKITEKLCEKICEIDPDGAERYKANAAAYVAKLDALDGEYSALVASSARKTVVFADRFPFRYLTRDYGLIYYAAFSGCSCESEASFKTMAFLINKTKELGLPSVFTIEGSDGSIAETVRRATGVKILALDSCQSVTAGDVKNGKSYLGAMRKNLDALREALN